VHAPWNDDHGLADVHTDRTLCLSLPREVRKNILCECVHFRRGPVSFLGLELPNHGVNVDAPVVRGDARALIGTENQARVQNSSSQAAQC
jgi:hypothetical protein